jgi:UDP-N-acetylmuramyl pentapeptide phosphotransferase/UDP-N-acetylglucosamine-1-phosphate transferase
LEIRPPGMVEAAAIALTTGLVSYLAIRALIPILQRRRVFAYPNERSLHQVPTPRGGGIAVICPVLLAWALCARWGWVPPGVSTVIFGAVLLALVSWIDDLHDLSPLPRLLAQGAAVVLGLFALPARGGLSTAAGFAATGLLWVWWINLFNFMDGIDGIAGSEAVAIGVGLLLFATAGTGVDPALAMLAAAVIGAALGFLVWNWPPARIFLGDFSAPLGYLLGFLLLDLAIRGHWKIAVILPLYFLADATITLARRLVRGERIWQAHREHFYQKAVRRGLGHADVVKRIIAADLMLIGCGWAAENGWGTASLAVSAATVIVAMATLSRGTG